VPQELALYEDLSAEKNLRFFASLYGLRGASLTNACQFALEVTGLTDRSSDKVSSFSGGMKRRLNIACSIAHKPELLIMDEPTVGIDPQSRNHILNEVRSLRDQGMTILYTTHYMEEVEEISTRIVIMDQGKIIAEGTNESLKSAAAGKHHYQITTDDELTDVTWLTEVDGIETVRIDKRVLDITTNRQVENLDAIIATVVSHGIRIRDISCQRPNLETVFLKLTGRSLRD